MAEYTGSTLYLLWNGTQIDAHYRNFAPTEAAAVVDGSAGSDTHNTYYNTLIDGNASLEMVAQDGTDGTALWAALAPSTEGTLEWGPEGTAVGDPRHHVNAVLTTRNPSYGYADITIWNIEWQFSDSDGPTHTVY